MSVKEFWEDDPDLFWAYRFSFYNKSITQQEIFNHNAWLQGAYIFEAVSVAICNSFSKQKAKYSEQPYDFNKKELSPEEEKKNAVDELKARVAQVKAMWNKKNNDDVIGGERR